MIIEQQFADLENWIFTGYLYRSHRPTKRTHLMVCSLGLFLNLCPANARCVKNSCAAVLEEVLVHRRGITDSSMTAASGGGRECEKAQKPESQAKASRLDETTWFQDARGRRYPTTI